ncbi:MAG: MFS transporter [Candidatus Sungbacteria bacterium]|uniref:MFS transporter n=1 Tax=Candidatus Sungiibacteriota bacterium TaxID=2750080 RepID=A0A931YCZ4_9BACT|nr:MFS transporter [Candidatus Sungbacteria bacterium]MBI2465643.1 MFS transporter [Candidatus Sungbacteria bacterium]
MRLYFNRALRVLLATNAAVIFASAMMAPIYAIFVEKIGGDVLDAGLTSGLFALVSGVVVLISGRASDKMKDSELLVIAGYFILGIAFFLYNFVNTIPSLFMIQALIGLGYAATAPAYDALYAKHVDGHRSGWQWSSWESMAYFATAAGSAAGGFIASEFGFNALFTAMSVLCLASALYMYLLPRRVL